MQLATVAPLSLSHSLFEVDLISFRHRTRRSGASECGVQVYYYKASSNHAPAASAAIVLCVQLCCSIVCQAGVCCLAQQLVTQEPVFVCGLLRRLL